MADIGFIRLHRMISGDTMWVSVHAIAGITKVGPTSDEPDGSQIIITGSGGSLYVRESVDVVIGLIHSIVGDE